MEFTHLDGRGQARMVDVTAKQPTVREARAEAVVSCSEQVMAELRDGTVPKGDVLAVAKWEREETENLKQAPHPMWSPMWGSISGL